MTNFISEEAINDAGKMLCDRRQSLAPIDATRKVAALIQSVLIDRIAALSVHLFYSTQTHLSLVPRKNAEHNLAEHCET